MRGEDRGAEGFLSYVRLEQRIPADHPLRTAEGRRCRRTHARKCAASWGGCACYVNKSTRSNMNGCASSRRFPQWRKAHAVPPPRTGYRRGRRNGGHAGQRASFARLARPQSRLSMPVSIFPTCCRSKFPQAAGRVISRRCDRRLQVWVAGRGDGSVVPGLVS
jgi:hypothetical protein